MSTMGANMGDAIKRRMDKQAADGHTPKPRTEADGKSFGDIAKAKLGIGK